MNPELAAVAARQGGVFLRRQALDAGYSSGEVSSRAGAEWVRLRRGAYVLRDTFEGADRDARHRLMVHAVMAATEVDPVVSGYSAAIMHRLAVWVPSLQRVQVTHVDATPRLETDVHHHRAELRDDDVVEVDGLPVTAVLRTVADVARLCSVESAVVTADSALRRLELPRDALDPLIARYGQWPRSAGLPTTVLLADGRSENVAESRLRVQVHELGLPAMTPQVAIYDDRFDLAAITDLLAIGHGVIAEFDGASKYGIDGQDPRVQVLAEKARADRLADLGYEITRPVWRDLEERQSLARKLIAAFRRAAARPAPTGYYRMTAVVDGRTRPVGTYLRPERAGIVA